MTGQLGGGFECLEDRTLLAANVTAVLSNGTLTVTGASSGAFVDDDLTFSGDGVAGHVTLDVNGAALKVNGVTDADGVFNFTGVRSITVSTTTGNDFVELYDLNISGNVAITGGLDNDSFELHSIDDDLFIGGNVTLTGESMEVYSGTYGYGVTIGKNVTMNGGSGDDYLAVYTDYGNSFVTVKGSVSMNGGNGNDDMYVTNADTGTGGFSDQASTLTILGTVNMFGGDGNDEGYVANWSDATYGDINVAGSLLLNGGNGNDILKVECYGFGSSINVTRSVVINGGTGNDTLSVASFNQQVEITVGTNLVLQGNSGDDVLELYLDNLKDQRIDVTGQVNLEGASGDDTLSLVNDGIINKPNAILEMGSLLIHGSDGDDAINAYGIAVVGNASLWGDNNDDSFNIVRNNVLGNLYVNGGFGVNDLLYDNLNFVGGTYQKTGIEFII